MSEYPYRDEEVDDRHQGRDGRTHVVGDDHLALVVTASHQDTLPCFSATPGAVVQPRMTAIHQVASDTCWNHHQQNANHDNPQGHRPASLSRRKDPHPEQHGEANT
ncbi:Uncharacterised protein [Mycobacteroides abscessus subsp. abscessus]|nr:Uncharacterised protein [Mycobacteroides abscessus subsp. abscessus]